MTATATHWILTLVCEDRPGIVHAISGAIVEASGNITESQQFSSDDTGRFFMRLHVESGAFREVFEAALAPVTERYGMTWQLDVVGRPLRTLVLGVVHFQDQPVSLLDLVFLGYAIALCRNYSDDLARRTFRYSILYLTLLFAALFADQYKHGINQVSWRQYVFAH